MTMRRRTSMTSRRSSSKHLRLGCTASRSMWSSRSRASDSVRLCSYFLFPQRTRLSPQLGTKSRARSCWNCCGESGLSARRKWQQTILTCSRQRRSSNSKCAYEGYNVQSLQLDSSNLLTRPLQKASREDDGEGGCGWGDGEGEEEAGEGGLSAAGVAGSRRRSLDYMVSSSMTMRCPGSSSMMALSSSRSPNDSSSFSSEQFSSITSESCCRSIPSRPQIFIKQLLAYTHRLSTQIYKPQTPPRLLAPPPLRPTSPARPLYYSMEGSDSVEKGAGKRLTTFLYAMTHSQNLEVLREEEARRGTAESRWAKRMFENSILCLFGNLAGLSAINLARGYSPAEHELKYRWSRPLHLALLLATALNLAAAGYLGYHYVDSSPESVQAIFSLAKDPRIYLDVDKVEGGEGQLTVVHRTLKEKLHDGQ